MSQEPPGGCLGKRHPVVFAMAMFEKWGNFYGISAKKTSNFNRDNDDVANLWANAWILHIL